MTRLGIFLYVKCAMYDKTTPITDHKTHLEKRSLLVNIIVSIRYRNLEKDGCSIPF